MKEKLLNAEKEVEQFLEMTLPDGASQTQINEVRKAFISGMKNFYFHMMRLNFENKARAEKELELYVKDIDKLAKKYIFFCK